MDGVEISVLSGCGHFHVNNADIRGKKLTVSRGDESLLLGAPPKASPLPSELNSRIVQLARVELLLEGRITHRLVVVWAPDHCLWSELGEKLK